LGEKTPFGADRLLLIKVNIPMNNTHHDVFSRKSLTPASLIFAREIESKLGESTSLSEVMKIEQRVYFAGWPARGVISFAILRCSLRVKLPAIRQGCPRRAGVKAPELKKTQVE